MQEIKKVSLTDLSFAKVQSIYSKVTLAIEKFESFAAEQRKKHADEVARLVAGGMDEEQAKKAAAGEEFGLDIFKRVINMLMVTDADLLMSIVADIFDCTAEEAREIPIKCWMDIVIKDAYIRPFLPAWYKLEHAMPLDT